MIKKTIILLFFVFIISTTAFAADARKVNEVNSTNKCTPFEFGTLNLINWENLQLVGENSNVYGLRLSIFHANNKNIIGTDFGPLGLNWVKNNMYGLQVGGANKVGKEFRGLQVGGVRNYFKNGEGIQLAGGINVSDHYDDLLHLQIGGLGNLGAGSVQIGGLGNFGAGVLQIGGLGNLGAGAGIQLTGGMNLSGVQNDYTGIQLAGLVNLCGDEMYGIQLAGLSNFGSYATYGIQVTGILNRAERMNGVQVGLINDCNTLTGVQIGAFNIIKDKNRVIPVINASF